MVESSREALNKSMSDSWIPSNNLSRTALMRRTILSGKAIKPWSTLWESVDWRTLTYKIDRTRRNERVCMEIPSNSSNWVFKWKSCDLLREDRDKQWIKHNYKLSVRETIQDPSKRFPICQTDDRLANGGQRVPHATRSLHSIQRKLLLVCVM